MTRTLSDETARRAYWAEQMEADRAQFPLPTVPQAVAREMYDHLDDMKGQFAKQMTARREAQQQQQELMVRMDERERFLRLREQPRELNSRHCS